MSAAAWEARSLTLRAEREREAERQRACVRSRLFPRNGRTEAELTAVLVARVGTEWSSGVGRILRDLEERGEAHQRDGQWFLGAVDRGATTTSPSPVPRPSSLDGTVLEVAKQRTWWFRAELASACRGLGLVPQEAERVIGDLVRSGALEVEARGLRVRSAETAGAEPVAGEEVSTSPPGLTGSQSLPGEVLPHPRAVASTESGGTEPADAVEQAVELHAQDTVAEPAPATQAGAEPAIPAPAEPRLPYADVARRMAEIVRRHPEGIAPAAITAELGGVAKDVQRRALRTARELGLVEARGATLRRRYFAAPSSSEGAIAPAPALAPADPQPYAGWTVEWRDDVLVGTGPNGQRVSLGDVGRDDASQPATYELTHPISGAVVHIAKAAHLEEARLRATRRVERLGGRFGPTTLPSDAPLAPTTLPSDASPAPEPVPNTGSVARPTDVPAQPEAGASGVGASPGASAPQAGPPPGRQPETAGADPAPVPGILSTPSRTGPPSPPPSARPEEASRGVDLESLRDRARAAGLEQDERGWYSPGSGAAMRLVGRADDGRWWYAPEGSAYYDVHWHADEASALTEALQWLAAAPITEAERPRPWAAQGWVRLGTRWSRELHGDLLAVALWEPDDGVEPWRWQGYLDSAGQHAGRVTVEGCASTRQTAQALADKWLAQLGVAAPDLVQVEVARPVDDKSAEALEALKAERDALRAQLAEISRQSSDPDRIAAAVDQDMLAERCHEARERVAQLEDDLADYRADLLTAQGELALVDQVLGQALADIEIEDRRVRLGILLERVRRAA